MNILMYVMTILMLLAMITYARLETYRNNAGTQFIFTHYMQKLERAPFNAIEAEWYDTITSSAPKKERTAGEGQEKSRKSIPRSGATSRLSFYYFVNEKGREKDQKEFLASLAMAKKLLFVLYSEQQFYKNMERERPGFLDEIFTSIMAAVDKLPDDKKITDAKELANLDLGDKKLNEVFYKMLKGIPNFDGTAPRPSEKSEEAQATASVDEGGEEPDADGKIDEITSEEMKPAPAHSDVYSGDGGYPSLLDFITLKNSKGIRLYLAPRAVLLAIFGDTNTVNAIIDYRKSLYGQLKSKKMTKIEATEAFKQHFGAQHAEGTDTAFFNYDVTTTNPKEYD